MRNPLFDFSDPSAANAWHAIDDRVMGGISRSTLRHDPRATPCSREPSRWSATAALPPCDPAPANAATRACLIEVRGDNKQFKLSLLTDDGFDSLNYQASFTPAGTDWQTMQLPLTNFRASFRGRDVLDAPLPDPARIRQVGLMLAARQAGPFEFQIRRICPAWSERGTGQ